MRDAWPTLGCPAPELHCIRCPHAFGSLASVVRNVSQRAIAIVYAAAHPLTRKNADAPTVSVLYVTDFRATTRWE